MEILNLWIERGYSSNKITFFFSGIYDQTENEVEGSQRFECQLDDGAIEQCPADFTDPSNDFFTGFKTYTGLTPEEHNFTVTAIINVDDNGEPVEIRGTPATWTWTVVNVDTTIDSQIDGNGATVPNVEQEPPLTKLHLNFLERLVPILKN